MGDSAIEDTFRPFYEQHFAFVWKSLRRLGIAERDCSDVTQDVFMIVHRNLSTLLPSVKPTTWMFGICLRVASDYRRRAVNRYEVLGDKGVPEPFDPPTAGEAVERKQAVTMLERMLESMPLEQRAVFVAFELSGLQCTEIAEAFELPLGTVYSRLRLGREHLQRFVERTKAKDRFTTGEVHHG